MAVARRDNGGGGKVYLYIVKTIAFKINPSGRTRIYEYAPPPPIIGLATVLFYLTLAVTLGK
jgi:hypothetical protein